jgi:hypothetical protein
LDDGEDGNKSKFHQDVVIGLYGSSECETSVG